MNNALSPNTQAILLLTAPLLLGKSVYGEAPLSIGEYAKLAAYLHAQHKEPANLIAASADDLIRSCAHIIDENRVRRLLERGFQLGQALERWRNRAIWVISRADPAYPRILKARLRHAAPPVLYGCGDIALSASGALAVVGSRHVSEDLLHFSQEIGHFCAEAGQTLVSGGARGIDQAAMRGSLQHGGKVIGILADRLEQAVLQRENRDALLNRHLILISPYDPSAGFHVGNAMQRNKLIYGLAQAGLVVNAELNKGGTWAGAIEQLESFRWIPIYVRWIGELTKGLEALRERGALPWPAPMDVPQLKALLRPISLAKTEPAQAELGFRRTAGG